MDTIQFGKTPYRVSRLGFGAMRLPTLPDGKVDFELSTAMLRFAIEHGVNFIDSHHFYHNGQSEEAIGKAIKGIPRESIILQTKIGMYKNYRERNCWKLLEQALKKLGTDYLDFYFTHSLSMKSYLKYNRLFLRFTDRAISRGLVRYRGFSVHDKPENIKKFIMSGEFSAMLLQYNILDRSNEEAIALAHERGLGVEVMGPVAGGMLGLPDESILNYSPVKARSTAELALRFVLGNSNVHVAFSGMSTLQQVKENVETASGTDRFSAEDIGKLDAVFEKRKKLLDLYCTGCGYCLPCPNKVNIPRIFRLYNLSGVYGLTERAKKDYLAMNPEEKVSSCVECGECEKKCPQKISIREKLKQARTHFEE